MNELPHARKYCCCSWLAIRTRKERRDRQTSNFFWFKKPFFAQERRIFFLTFGVLTATNALLLNSRFLRLESPSIPEKKRERPNSINHFYEEGGKCYFHLARTQAASTQRANLAKKKKKEKKGKKKKERKEREKEKKERGKRQKGKKERGERENGKKEREREAERRSSKSLISSCIRR